MSHRLAVPALLLGLVAFLLASALSFWPYTVDDAFISLRYAQNLVEHGELAWNLGERVEGISNPLWTLWAAVGLSSGVAIVPWLKVSGLVCGLALVPATFGLARRCGLDAPVGLMAAVLVATNVSVALWSVAGLETTSFALMLVLFAWRLEGELKARADGASPLPISALFFALAWASRPEAPAYGLYLVVRRFLAGDRPALGKADLVWLAVAGVPIAAYEIFGLVYFGGLLPATHSAKVGGGSPFLEAVSKGQFGRFLGTRFLLGQGAMFAALWIAGLVGALAAVRRLPAAAWAMGASGLVFVAYAFVDWMPRFRFFVPPLPFLAIVVAVGLERIATAFPGRSRRVGWALCGALLIGGAYDQGTRAYDRDHEAVVAVGPRGAWPLEFLSRAATPWEPGRQEVDAWFVVRETPREEWIACPDIGFIGAFARNPIWDIRGLVTPEAAAFLPVEKDDPSFEPVRRAMLDGLFKSAPAYVLLPRRPQGMAPQARRFMEAFESDPRCAQRYERIIPFIATRVVWRRKDFVAPTAIEKGERTQRVLDAFPTYRTERSERFVRSAAELRGETPPR